MYVYIGKVYEIVTNAAFIKVRFIKERFIKVRVGDGNWTCGAILCFIVV